jgi:WD40 repeat protein
MKKYFVAVALWVSVGIGIVSAQTSDAEITATDFKIDTFNPQYAWDFSGGPFTLGGEKGEVETMHQLVVIIDKKRTQYYDLKGAGNYIGRDLPSPVVLLSNASRNLFAYSGEDNKIRIAGSTRDWHTITEKQPAKALAMGNASDILAVSIPNEAGKNIIKIYEHGMSDVKLVKTLEGAGNLALTYLTFSENDKKILASDDENIIVWNVETGKEIGRHKLKKELMMDKIRVPTIAEDKNVLAYVKNKQTVVLLDLDNPSQEKTINTEKLAQDVALSADGNFLYVCYAGNFLKYAVASGRTMTHISTTGPMTFCTFSPNGLFALVVPFSGNQIGVKRLNW